MPCNWAPKREVITCMVIRIGASVQKKLSYVIFPTAWGYFGLVTENKSLYRTCLPITNPEDVKKRLLSSIPGELEPE